jgi:ribonuclease Z
MTELEILKLQYLPRLVNGHLGDPGLMVELTKTGGRVLFDAGSLHDVSRKELLKVQALFVSHTHVDHFIGFDQLLRVNIPMFRTLQVIGPKGITANVAGKLSGYLWNLLDKDQIKIIVHEYTGPTDVKSALLSNTFNFEPQMISTNDPGSDFRGKDSDGTEVFRLPDGSTVSPVILDHGTPSLGFKMSTPPRWQVQPNKIDQLGLNPGPWLGLLQKHMHKQVPEIIDDFNGTGFSSKELADHCLTLVPSTSIAYLTDFGFSETNLKALKNSWKRVTSVVCETSFQDKDRDRALKTSHLSTIQAALIAGYLEADELIPFHISSLYGTNQEASMKECLENFHHYKGLSPEELEQEISTELQRDLSQ